MFSFTSEEGTENEGPRGRGWGGDHTVFPGVGAGVGWAHLPSLPPGRLASQGWECTHPSEPAGPPWEGPREGMLGRSAQLSIRVQPVGNLGGPHP